MEIHPTNIAVASLLTQVLIILTLNAGILLLGAGEYKRMSRVVHLNRIHDPLKIQIMRVPWPSNVVLILTLLVLVFSDDLVKLWRPVINSHTLSIGLETTAAISFIILVDIFVVTYLVLMTEGSRRSPFSPVFFILPTAAIFLRQPLFQLIIYICLIFVLFTALMRRSRLADSVQLDSKIARSYWIVSSLCFGLTTLLAIITRPL